MMLRAEPLAALPGVTHAFFTRAGGVSEGIFASLNCGFGSRDDPAHVADIDAALHRLVDPADMGVLFRALAVVPPGAPAPAGFEAAAP